MAKFEKGDRVVCTRDHHSVHKEGLEVVVGQTNDHAVRMKWFTAEPDIGYYADEQYYEHAKPFWNRLTMVDE